VKIAVLGGGGFRVPMVYGALLSHASRLGIDDVALYDIDASRLASIDPVLRGLERQRGVNLPFAAATDLDAALDGADFVFCAIRVGGLDGRVVDERVAVDAGVIGQETVGPGGIGFALRTIPVMLDLAERVAVRAPDAWFVNFTNPAGLVTEAIQEVLGGRAVGICDSPTALCRRVAGALGRPASSLRFDYFGLNHLGWLRGVYAGDEDLLPGLLADDEQLQSFEEGQLFGGEWLRALGMIPNEYLYFYYYAADAVGVLRSGVELRAEFLLRQQRPFYEAHWVSPEAALAGWLDTRREREQMYFAEARAAAGIAVQQEWDDIGGYEGEALAVVDAVVRNESRMLILDVANRSSLPFLDPAAVVEVPSFVGSTGVVPTAVGEVPGHARALMEAIKAVDRLTIRAARERSLDLAVQAIALHPLVPSVKIARRIVAGYASGHPELAEWSR